MNVHSKRALLLAARLRHITAKKRLKNTLLAFVGLSSSACLSTVPPPTADPAMQLLNSVALEVSTLTRQVSEIQQASYPVFSEPSVRDPALLSQISVLDYVGSPANLLQELATRIGYNYIQLGTQTLNHNKHSMPFSITVSIRSRQQSVINIVREIAAQVGNDIVVSVSEAQQELRLEYL